MRGGCSDDGGPEGPCPNCPLHRLDEEMAGPLGLTIHRAFRLARRKAAGFLLIAETLPSDVVTAFEILCEEHQVFVGENRQREQEMESVNRELGKRG